MSTTTTPNFQLAFYSDLLSNLPPGKLSTLGNRIAKALEIASAPHMIFPSGKDPALFCVRSQRMSSTFYEVNTVAKSCTCKDSQHGHPCKHRIAVWLYTHFTAKYHGMHLPEPTQVTRQQVIKILATHGGASRLFATHVPTGRRVEILDYVKTEAPTNNIGITAKFTEEGKIITLARRSDFTDLFISN